MKKGLVLVLAITFLSLLISGCAAPGSVVKEVTLTLGGFPINGQHEYNGFSIEQYSNDSSTNPLSSHSYHDVDLSDTISFKIPLESGCKKIVVSLFSGTDYREYYWEFAVLPGVKDYTSMYWLTVNTGEYGFSDQLAVDVDLGVTQQVDFSQFPVALFKVADARNQNYEVKITPTKGAVKVIWGSGAVDPMYGSYTKINIQGTILISDIHDPILYIGVTSVDPRVPASAQISILHTGRTMTKGMISALVPGNTPDLVFAADIDYETLYYINPLEKEIAKEVEIPEPRPVDMAYSPIDNKLYFVSQCSGYLLIYDVAQEIFTKIQYAKLADGLGIKVAPDCRRIFVNSTEGIFLVDMDTLQVVSQIDEQAHSIAIDQVGHKLYFSTNSDDCRVEKYSFSDGQLSYERETGSLATSAGEINITPDGTTLLFTKLNYPEPATLILETDKLSQLGRYNFVATRLIPGIDNSTIYAVIDIENADRDMVYTLDLHNYSVVKKFSLPYAIGLVTPNSDGNVLVFFTANTETDDYALYYYDLR